VFCALISAVLLAGSSFSARLLSAQNTGTITGRTLDAVGQPMVGVQVYLVGRGLGTLSGANGRYAIVNVPAGNYRMRAERIGTRTVEADVVVPAGQSVTQDFTLREEALGLDQIVVTGTAGAARRREVGNSITQLNLNKIQEPPVSVSQLLQGRSPA
jgi:hypothetical protein